MGSSSSEPAAKFQHSGRRFSVQEAGKGKAELQNLPFLSDVPPYEGEREAMPAAGETPLST